MPPDVGGEAIASRIDAALETAHDPKRASHMAEVRRLIETKDEKAREVAAYYLTLAANTDVPSARVAGVFDRLLGWLEQFLSFFKRPKSMIWDVLPKIDDYYLRLRGEIAEWQRRNPEVPVADALMLLPDAVRLYVRLLVDERVASSVKRQIVLGLAYVISPFDLLPEALLGPLGYIDDVVMLAHMLGVLVDEKKLAPGLIREHWAGTDAEFGTLVKIAIAFQDRPFVAILRNWINRSDPKQQASKRGRAPA